MHAVAWCLGFAPLPGPPSRTPTMLLRRKDKLEAAMTAVVLCRDRPALPAAAVLASTLPLLGPEPE